MNALLRRLGSPDAISWPLAVVVVVQQALGALVTPNVNVDGRWFEFAVVRVLGWAALVGMLGVGKLVLTHFARERPQPIVTVATFVGASYVDVVVQNLLLGALGFTGMLSIATRMTMSITGKFAVFFIGSALISLAREYSRQNRVLESAATELLRLRTEVTERVQRRRRDLVNAAERELNAALLAQGATTEQVRGMMMSLIDDVVRPMSYRLTQSVETETLRIAVVPSSTISWRSILEYAMSGKPLRPLWTSAWMGAMVLTVFTIYAGPAGVASGFVVFLIVWAGLAAVNALWPRLLMRPPYWRAVAVTNISVAAVVLLPLQPVVLTSGRPIRDAAMVLSWMVLGVTTTWMITLVSSVFRLLRATATRLETVNDELKRELISANAEYRRVNRQVSRALHGPVQQAINAALHKLRDQPSPVSVGELMSDLKLRIESALHQIASEPADSLNLERQFVELTELWDGIARVSIEFAPRAATEAQSHPDTVVAVHDIVTECVGNAIRHGSAARVDVTISVDDERRALVVVVSNDGHPVESDTPRGLGSAMLDDMCLSWDRRPTPTGTQVRAEVPIPG